MDAYPLTLIILLAALLVYSWAGAKVARARTRLGVTAPAVTGNAEFERIFRAQQNTVEQIVLFVPVLLAVAALWGDVWAFAYGAVWCVGRILYVEAYARQADKRGLGFMLSGGLSMLVLLACLGTALFRYLVA